jgi:hypothetical protein
VRQLDCRAFGELNNRGLGRAVRHDAGAGLDPADRGHIDDRSPAVFGHVPPGLSGTRHQAQNVDRHDAVKIGQIVIEETAMHLARDPGVVHHHVQTAELLDGRCHQRAGLFGIGYVGRPKESIRAQPRGKGFAAVDFDIGDDDAPALGHKSLDHAATQTRCPACDDGYLARKFVDHTTS